MNDLKPINIKLDELFCEINKINEKINDLYIKLSKLESPDNLIQKNNKNNDNIGIEIKKKNKISKLNMKSANKKHFDYKK